MRYSIQHDNITTTASVGKVGPGLSHSPRGMGCHKTTILSAPKRLLTLAVGSYSFIYISKGSMAIIYTRLTD